MTRSLFSVTLKLTAIAAATISLSACAVYAPPVCNAPGAYAQGVNDGQARLLAQVDYAQSCAMNQGRINRAYYRGYRHGRR